MNRINCWEYWKCGREIGGSKENELGICPVVRNITHKGINGGIGAGRICWEIVGTSCHNVVPGIANETMNCAQCDFFILVKSEEREAFIE